MSAVEHLVRGRQRQLAHRAEMIRQVREIERRVNALASRIEGIVATAPLGAYEPAIPADGSRYDAAAGGRLIQAFSGAADRARLAEAVNRRFGLSP